MLTQEQRDRVRIVLVSPRNPLNIGAVARAMANFGFAQLTVVSPYAPHWREARSAVGAPDLLREAREADSIRDAIADCTFVAGTGTLTHRRPEQPVVSLPDVLPMLEMHLASEARIALVFGPEKHGLTRDDLSYCNVLIEIPTDVRQPSMNLGQAVAVCLYELSRTSDTDAPHFSTLPASPHAAIPQDARQDVRTSSANLDRLAELIEQAMTSAGYSPRTMQQANRHDLRLLLRRLAPTSRDTRRMLGLFRRILHRLKSDEDAPKSD